MSEQLKPCPFCGGAAILYGNEGRSTTVECTVCGANGGEYADFEHGDAHKKAALAAWNHRMAPEWQPGEPEIARQWATGLLAELSTKPAHADDCLWLERLIQLAALSPQDKEAT